MPSQYEYQYNYMTMEIRMYRFCFTCCRFLNNQTSYVQRELNR